MADPKARPPRLRALIHETVRAQIAETAWGLIAKHGLDSVTIDEIAEASEISRSSFFRYFSSKEEAVLVPLESIGAEIAIALEERPPREGSWEALLRACETTASKCVKDPLRLLARLRLIRETPSLRAHQLAQQAQWRTPIGRAMAIRNGQEAQDVRVEAVAGAAIVALDTASQRWALSDGKLDLTALIDDAFRSIGDLDIS